MEYHGHHSAQKQIIQSIAKVYKCNVYRLNIILSDPFIPHPTPPSRASHTQRHIIHPRPVHILPTQDALTRRPFPKHGVRITPEITAVGHHASTERVLVAPTAAAAAAGVDNTVANGTGESVETEKSLPRREEALLLFVCGAGGGGGGGRVRTHPRGSQARAFERGGTG